VRLTPPKLLHRQPELAIAHHNAPFQGFASQRFPAGKALYGSGPLGITWRLGYWAGSALGDRAPSRPGRRRAIGNVGPGDQVRVSSRCHAQRTSGSPHPRIM
jgi:hypothetical protein